MKLVIMNLKYVNYTDLIVVGASALILIAFLFSSILTSVFPLYVSSLVLSAFTYWAIRKDASGALRRSLIIGGIGELFYTWVDKLFVELGLITYIGIRDLKIPNTPVSVALTWLCCITIGLYIYQRLRSVFGGAYIPAVLTGASAFLAGVALNSLGAQLWRWSSVWLRYRDPASAPQVASMPCIGSVPLFVPVALLVTFLLSPYIIGGQRFSRWLSISDNVIVAGLRCAVLLSMTIYLSFIILTRLI